MARGNPEVLSKLDILIGQFVLLSGDERVDKCECDKSEPFV